MRLVFAGTPDAAVASLAALLESRHEVAAVVTRPDAPAGRGLRTAASPVAELAGQAGLEVLKPRRVRDPEFQARLRELEPDCCAITAYGALIPDEVLAIPAHGWVNLHFSLLPAWRGAAPVQRALMAGDDLTGATTFRLVRELDAGPVYGMVTEPVSNEDTAGTLLERLAVSGAGLLVATMDGIGSGSLEAREQPADGVSLAPKVTPDEARVTWAHPALVIGRQIRGCTPQPGAWTELAGTRLKLGPLASLNASGGAPLAPGEMRIERSRVLVGTGTAPVELGEVQPHGKRPMAAAAWARGLRLAEPARLA